jgi:LmbE family N-acetylglucosaminyl deacetylase
VSVPEEVVIEREGSGEPHRGQVLAAVFPHTDDFAIFVGGTFARLVREGYEGYLIRTSNDEMDSYDLSLGETVLGNERDFGEVARLLGARGTFDLGYRNHFLDTVPPTEIRHRLITLFRFLKVDTVISFDPWGHYEENPDHFVTALAVEAACWMSGGHLDLPEHFAMGLRPRAVRERYYTARGPQLLNRVVEITSFLEVKMRAICACRTQLANMMGSLRDQLRTQGNPDPELEAGGEPAARTYAERTFLPANTRLGGRFGLGCAEGFHHIRSLP